MSQNYSKSRVSNGTSEAGVMSGTYFGEKVAKPVFTGIWGPWFEYGEILPQIFNQFQQGNENS